MSIRRIRSTAASVLFALTAMLGASVAAPPPVAACSCAMNETLAQSVGPQTVVFAGTNGGRGAVGLDVTVDEWFVGAGAAPVVQISNASFGDGAACGLGLPPMGSRWIWIGYRERPLDPIESNICEPSADLGSPDGQAKLAEARATFTALAIPPGERAPEVAAPGGSPPPGEDTRARALVMTGGAVAAIVVLLFGGVVLLARRRPSRP